MNRYSFKFIGIYTVFIFLVSCKQASQNTIEITQESLTVESENKSEEKIIVPPAETKKSEFKLPAKWIELTTDSAGILLDIKYATKDNFTKQQIYGCGRCYLRTEAAKKIISIQNDLRERYGFGLKLFDCYRPRPAQQKLWDIVPDPNYVTPPEKGSMHNRGLAVDLTIVDKSGQELDMGTSFDYFGKEAHHDYEEFPADIQKNRVLIKKIMELHGFSSIRTEWWHYSLTSVSYPLASWEWPCD